MICYSKLAGYNSESERYSWFFLFRFRTASMYCTKLHNTLSTPGPAGTLGNTKGTASTIVLFITPVTHGTSALPSLLHMKVTYYSGYQGHSMQVYKVFTLGF